MKQQINYLSKILSLHVITNGLENCRKKKLTLAQCKAKAQKTANILKLFSSVLEKALPLILFTICTTPITLPRLTIGMHRIFLVV